MVNKDEYIYIILLTLTSTFHVIKTAWLSVAYYRLRECVNAEGGHFEHHL